MAAAGQEVHSKSEENAVYIRLDVEQQNFKKVPIYHLTNQTNQSFNRASNPLLARTYPPSPACAAVHLQASPQSPSHIHSTSSARAFQSSPHPSHLWLEKRAVLQKKPPK